MICPIVIQMITTQKRGREHLNYKETGQFVILKMTNGGRLSQTNEVLQEITRTHFLAQDRQCWDRHFDIGIHFDIGTDSLTLG